MGRDAFWQSAGVALMVGSLGVGCTDPAGGDEDLASFNRLIVAGACQTQGLDSVEISALLLNGPEVSLTPTSRLRGESAALGPTLEPNAFVFSHTGEEIGREKEGMVDLSGGGGRSAVALRAEAVEFEYNGGAAAQTKPRLVVFLLDHSGSLIGTDRTGRIPPEGPQSTATDRFDQRIAFFSQLLQGLPDPATDEVSLVWFNDLPHILPKYSTPTRDRDAILTGLQRDVSFVERGGTALSRALDDTFRAVISSNPHLNPVVVLFTDGVEDEDDLDLTAVTAKYAERNVPIIVLDVQGRANGELQVGRDRKLRDLACATRGEYIYPQRADELSRNPTLLPLVRNRLVGAWKLRVLTDLEAVAGDADEAFLTTVLTATLGQFNHSFPMVNRPDFDDSRLWFLR